MAEIGDKQNEVSGFIIRRTRAFFISNLIRGMVSAVIWTIGGHLVPAGNWSMAFNIVMLLVCLFFMSYTSYNFYRVRVRRSGLAFLLTGLTIAAVILGLRILVNLIYFAVITPDM